jgi:hypothetical protein
MGIKPKVQILVPYLLEANTLESPLNLEKSAARDISTGAPAERPSMLLRVRANERRLLRYEDRARR